MVDSIRLAVSIITFALCSLICGAQSLQPMLNDLDKTIESAGDFEKSKVLRIQTLENLLDTKGISLEQKYIIYSQLYDEYLDYNFNKARETVEKNKEVATRLKDGYKMNEVMISEAMLNTVGGMFHEAASAFEAIDTTSLSGDLQTEYWAARRRFWEDYRNYVKDDKEKEPMASRIRYYQDMIMEHAPESSPVRRETAVLGAMFNGDWTAADSLNRALIASLDAGSHAYAVQTYWQGRICEAMGKDSETCQWFVRSAMTDIKTATKDNASLFSLAQELFRTGDLERAFRYSRISLDDALAFDAKLRQWQISAVLPSVQNGYMEMRDRNDRKARTLIIIISLLAALNLLGAIWMFRQYKKQKIYAENIRQMNEKIQQYMVSLEEVNTKLKDMNGELSEANAAKEEYIALFLSMCSSYIDKMKENQSMTRKKILSGKTDELLALASDRTMIENELKEFYMVFDKAFLKLYPKFITQFNELLSPEGRIELKKDEFLNTELRIFALIRLGITQSSMIASLLRYSVNTIYNYRAQIKNVALGDRETFEERVQSIGN